MLTQKIFKVIFLIFNRKITSWLDLSMHVCLYISEFVFQSLRYRFRFFASPLLRREYFFSFFSRNSARIIVQANYRISKIVLLQHIGTIKTGRSKATINKNLFIPFYAIENASVKGIITSVQSKLTFFLVMLKTELQFSSKI